MWIVDHWKELALIVTGVVTAASVSLHALAPLTSTDADDRASRWLDKLVALLEKLALNKR